MAMAADVFKEKAHELENASRYKSEFLANMSHELRTPLNSMLILSKMLSRNEKRNLDADQVESAAIMHESGTALLGLINDILDLSKVEAGRMEVVTESLSPETFIQRMERQFKHLAANKGLTLETSVRGSVPESLVSDWDKIEQIVRNFLSNALKFTAQGSITVWFHRPDRGVTFLHPDLRPSESLALSVSDTGIGIPKDKREQIFEAFRQVDGATSRQYGGTGLGLSISRKFADLIGGEIQVRSEEGVGSTFTLYLPLVFPDARFEERAAFASTRLDTDNSSSRAIFRAPDRHVLVVDDDRRNAFAIRQILGDHVASILTAENGKEALDQLHAHPEVDIVLMDIMMPVMDGYQAIAEIRANKSFASLPVIALTAKAMPGDRERCLQAGASDYLAKPVDPDALMSKMTDWLRKGKEVAAKTPHISSDTESGGSEEQSTIAVTSQKLPSQGRDSRERAEVESNRVIVGRNGEPASCLIVDDDMRNTFSMTKLLQPYTERVHMAHDGVRAMEIVEKHRDIDIVLLDIMMPEMDGFETIQRLRTLPYFKELAVVVITAKQDQDVKETAYSLGADAFLTKPLDTVELLQTLHGLFHRTEDKEFGDERTA
ncbi:MAG: response regulator [Magnetococcales bacterium]|nr:response regulator [Magnetococcales bacterium]